MSEVLMPGAGGYAAGATVTMMPANDTRIVIPRSARIEGLLNATTDIEVHGVVDGELRAKRLLIGPTGRVLGLVVAELVEIMGEVGDASVFAERVVLGNGCDVEAELHYRHLDIDEGALFEGKTRRHDSPLKLAPPLELSAAT